MAEAAKLARFREASKFAEFLLTLETDKSFRGRYLNDPQTTMDDFGLTQRQIAIVLTGDSAAVQREWHALRGHYQTHPVIVSVSLANIHRRLRDSR